jgi:hypothetical protein
VTSAPDAVSTVASAAGPHWYFSCGKKGVPASSVRVLDNAGPRVAQPPSATQKKMAKHAVENAACFAMTGWPVVATSS